MNKKGYGELVIWICKKDSRKNNGCYYEIQRKLSNKFVEKCFGSEMWDESGLQTHHMLLMHTKHSRDDLKPLGKGKGLWDVTKEPNPLPPLFVCVSGNKH